MTAERRLSICYLVPGHNLLPSAGPTRNVLSVARELGKWADVTVAFGRVLEPVAAGNFSIVEIDPKPAGRHGAVDDAAARGVGYREFAGYVRAVRRFADEQLPRYDVVLEKSWLFTGAVTTWCARHGVPSIPNLNVVPVLNAPWRSPRKAAQHWIARSVSGRHLRRAPLMVAESDVLKRAIVRRWEIPAERIEVVTLGVDRATFQPQSQEEARRALRIGAGETVLVYVGGLDRAHDLEPVVEAIMRAGNPALQLHVVGDGELRARLEQIAGDGSRVRFHGRVPHRDVPTYIAAADLCLAPYNPGHFPGREIGYATLKIREYLAAGRPVATAPSDLLPDLICHGVNGYSLENDVVSWIRFFQSMLPGRDRLRTMGAAAAMTPLDTWEDTARAYYALCQRVVKPPPRSAPAISGPQAVLYSGQLTGGR